MKDTVRSREGTILREKVLFFEREDPRLRFRGYFKICFQVCHVY